MTQPLISDSDALVANSTTFKVSLTALELQFMDFQMDASIRACNRACDDPLNNAHIQGLKRIWAKFQNAMVIGNPRI